MTWLIFRVIEPAHRGVAVQETFLGSVEADSHPAALLKAFERFHIRTNREQRKISARRD
jgi:hypothetical protein